MRIDWRRLSMIWTLVLTLLALGMVIQALQHFTWAKIVASLTQIGPTMFAWSGLCSVASYVVLTGFDWLGVAYAGASVPYRRVALASFLSLSIGHTVGFSPLSSGTIRYRYYADWGVSAVQVGFILLSSAITVLLGEAVIAGLALLFRPSLSGRLLGLGEAATLAASLACLSIPVVFWLAAGSVHSSFSIRGRVFRLPCRKIAAGQIMLGAVNYAFVAGALFCVLSAVAPVDYATVATAYVLANMAALLTHVPGGIGVLEAVIVLLLPGIDAIGPLIAFRIVYFLIPLLLGCLLLAGIEFRQWIRSVKSEF